MELNGTSAVVSGGASGLGEATARVLAAAGATVVIADLNENRGKQIADEIGGPVAPTHRTRQAALQAPGGPPRAPRGPPAAPGRLPGHRLASPTVGRYG